jgi:Uma2 family endonuclease
MCLERVCNSMNTQILEQLTDKFTEHEQRLLLQGVSWQQYRAIATNLESVTAVRLSYFHSILEFMTISEEHEDINSLIGTLIELYLLNVGIRYYRRGGPTLKQEPDVELIPDETFHLGEKKAVPDLAIEVVVTSGSTAKLKGYKTLGVSEVWFWKNQKLSLYVLIEREYQEVAQSQVLPDLNLELLVRCLNIPDQFDAVTEFRRAIASEL